jgi:hypothetical protein
MSVLDVATLVASNPDEFMADPDLDIIKDVDPAYWKIDDDKLVEMDQAEKDVVDTERLPSLKVAKDEAIDKRTGELIAKGFDYDDHHFSMSSNAQATLSAVAMEARMNDLTYPAKVSTADESVEYEIGDQPALRALYRAFNTRLRNRLQSGRTIKKEVRDATTKAELDAIVDPR